METVGWIEVMNKLETSRLQKRPPKRRKFSWVDDFLSRNRKVLLRYLWSKDNDADEKRTYVRGDIVGSFGGQSGETPPLEQQLLHRSKELLYLRDTQVVHQVRGLVHQGMCWRISMSRS